MKKILILICIFTAAVAVYIGVINYKVNRKLKDSQEMFARAQRAGEHNTWLKELFAPYNNQWEMAAALRDCKTDDDCVAVPTSTNSCATGGYTVINKKYAEAFTEKTMQIMTNAARCVTVKPKNPPICENGKCKLDIKDVFRQPWPR